MGLTRYFRSLLPTSPPDDVARTIGQRTLLEQYRARLAAGQKLPSFADAAFRCRSQNGEDGIILLILAAIGMGGRRAVELCAGDGLECNTANLVLHHGWQCLMVDGDAALIERGRAFYRAHPDTRIWPPRLAQAWVTAQGVNGLLSEHGFTGEIDILSLDLDGVDYWIWHALVVALPRLVVVEYQTGWGPSVAKTVPNDPQFRLVRNAAGETVYGAGASLGAFVKLAGVKGYRLVGCEPYGFNAFFLRNDIGASVFPEVPPETGFVHPHAAWCMDKSLAPLACYSWVDV